MAAHMPPPFGPAAAAPKRTKRARRSDSLSPANGSDGATAVPLVFDAVAPSSRSCCCSGCLRERIMVCRLNRRSSVVVQQSVLEYLMSPLHGESYAAART
ncbi:unnamed protein product [Ectocarpus sp. 12 AP-2014]